MITQEAWGAYESVSFLCPTCGQRLCVPIKTVHNRTGKTIHRNCPSMHCNAKWTIALTRENGSLLGKFIQDET